MTVLDKISFLQNALHLTEKEFATHFNIKLSLLKKWKANKVVPNEKELSKICREFNLDVKDFMCESSSLLKSDIPEGEHACQVLPVDERDGSVIFEDFAREDNSRYEEKD